MPDKVRWGVLGTANIAVRDVIPAMQRSRWARVEAIASRQLSKAQTTARQLGIPRAYGAYEHLLADPDIEAVYIPLPNHLHAPWSIEAAREGKHVLCEKPVSLTAGQVHALIEIQARTGVRIQEAFMQHTHPQWRTVLDLVASDRIGRVRAMQGAFTYRNMDPDDIRNVAEYGGGALMDVGCYLVFAARRVFGAQPRRVLGSVQRSAELGTDILTSGVLEFDGAQCVFTCSTQAVHSQRLNILGDRARMEMEYPFNPPPDAACRVFINDGRDLFRDADETIHFDPCDQFLLQADDFSRSIREGTPQSLPLSESLDNMAVIEAIFRSAESGEWEVPVPA